MDKKRALNKIQEVRQAVEQGSPTLETIIYQTALSLENELNFAFPIDEETKKLFEDINKNLDISKRIAAITKKIGDTHTSAQDSLIGQKQALQQEMMNAKNEMNKYIRGSHIMNQTLYNQAKAKYEDAKQKVAELGQQIAQEQAKIQALKSFGRGGRYVGYIPLRKREIQKIVNAHSIFDMDKSIAHTTLTIGASATSPYPYDLDALFNGNTPGNKEYMFYDEKQNKIFSSRDPIVVFAKTIDGNDVQVTLKGIKIDGTPPKLSITNLQVEGDISKSPLQIRDLYIRGVYQDTEGHLFYHDKKLSLTINNPIITRDQRWRSDQIDFYNTSGPNPGVITRSLDARFTNDGIKLQKQAVFDALKKFDGPKFDKLNDTQKEEFFRLIYERYNNPACSPGVTIGDMTTTRFTYIQNINNYNRFRDRMSADDHESNTLEYIKSEESYRNYVHNNLEEQTSKYITAQLNTLFSDNLDTNMYLKVLLSDFLTDLENRRMDDDTHAIIDGGLEPDAMENYRRFGRFGRRDVNYGRFFAGRSSKKIDATVTLDTSNEAFEHNKQYPNPLTYSLQTTASGDSIKASITMPGLGELHLKGREPNAIVREILRRTDIPFGKLRCHIAYSFLKSMVQMAKDAHISLNYTDPATGNKRRIILDDKNKIRIEQRDDHTNHSTAGAWRRIEILDFNEDLFDNNQIRDDPADNRSLRRGIEFLMNEFNCAMNQYHRHYRTATERRRRGLRKGEMRTTLPTNFFLSPIKTIRKRLGAKMDFAFSASTSGGDKSASIEFTGRQFKISINGKTYTHRNLGTILLQREGGRRVFDGIEREICTLVYKQLITKLRENTRVASKNFGVVDPMTQGVYMIDSDGEWSYIEPENARNANICRSRFMDHMVGATVGAGVGAAVGAGGAALLGKGLFKGSIIGSGIGTLTRAFLGGIDTRNSYGEIKHPPTTRRELSKEEQEELYHNPLLMARIIRAMSDALRW